MVSIHEKIAFTVLTVFAMGLIVWFILSTNAALNDYDESIAEKVEENEQIREIITQTVNTEHGTTDAFIINIQRGRYEVLAGGEIYTAIYNEKSNTVSVFKPKDP